jgi:hypothetical protein
MWLGAAGRALRRGTLYSRHARRVQTARGIARSVLPRHRGSIVRSPPLTLAAATRVPMAHKDPDFYGVLGVPRTATETEARRG